MAYTQQYGAYPNFTPPPPRPSNSSNGLGKNCLGCGCVFLLVVAIAIGIGCWLGYKYMKDNNTDLQELWDTWVYDSDTDYDAALNATYKGRPLSELAEEKGFPDVAYDERPQEVVSYSCREEGLFVRFNFLAFRDGESIGIMTLTSNGSQDTKMLRLAPCGCSIYHLTDPKDESMDGFLFVYKRAEHLILHYGGKKLDFRLNSSYDDEEEDDD